MYGILWIQRLKLFEKSDDFVYTCMYAIEVTVSIISEVMVPVIASIRECKVHVHIRMTLVSMVF